MTATTFAEYVSTNRRAAKKTSADIMSRWTTRVVARGLHKLGAAGAVSYLRDYGRGISAAKVIALAVVAEAEGCDAIALGFWSAAYTLATADIPTAADLAAVSGGVVLGGTVPATTPAVRVRPSDKPTVPSLAKGLQPGALITMQPVDASKDRDFYCASPAYVGQPKRDGNRMVVIASAGAVYYQSRSLTLKDAPDASFDAACREVAAEQGTFILDGELLFLSCVGSEHRTGAQAAQANAECGKPTAAVLCQFSVFKALMLGGRDLTGRQELERISAGEIAVDVIRPVLQRHAGWVPSFQIEQVPTAYTESQKRALCASQLAEGREGEVWIRADAVYVGGKNGEDIVRTKYLTETEVVVTGLTPTTVAGRPFGAIEVAEILADGSLRSAGSVGTGFSGVDAKELADLVAASPNQVRITVMHQGWTEKRQLWHARYVGLAA